MPQRPQDPWLGALLAGRYVLEARLGEGGMGHVYRSRAGGQAIAVKIIHRHLASHPNIVQRFRREVAITRRIDSPYTIRILEDDYTEDGVLYMTMELLEGRTLGEYLHLTGAMPPDQVARIGAQIARGLAAAHREGVVHRDLKSANVMLIAGERVKILDFGIARALQVDADGVDVSEQETQWQALTRAGALIGTLEYMSPEQVAHEPLGPRSDLYSLGVLLYEMAAGRLPFSCPNPRAALKAHLYTDPPPIPGLSPPLWELINELLAKRPEDRPADGLQVAERLEALAADDLPTMRMARTMVPELPDLDDPASGPPERRPYAPTPSRTMVPEVPGFGDEPALGDPPTPGPLTASRTMIPEGLDAPLDPIGADPGAPPSGAPMRSSLTLIPDALDDYEAGGDFWGGSDSGASDDATDDEPTGWTPPPPRQPPEPPAPRAIPVQVPKRGLEPVPPLPLDFEDAPTEAIRLRPAVPRGSTPAADPPAVDLPALDPPSAVPVHAPSAVDLPAIDLPRPTPSILGLPELSPPEPSDPTAPPPIDPPDIPAVDPPATDAPAVEPPVTEPPAIAPPTVEPPVQADPDPIEAEAPDPQAPPAVPESPPADGESPEEAPPEAPGTTPLVEPPEPATLPVGIAAAGISGSERRVAPEPLSEDPDAATMTAVYSLPPPTPEYSLPGPAPAAIEPTVASSEPPPVIPPETPDMPPAAQPPADPLPAESRPVLAVEPRSEAPPEAQAPQAQPPAVDPTTPPKKKRNWGRWLIAGGVFLAGLCAGAIGLIAAAIYLIKTGLLGI